MDFLINFGFRKPALRLGIIRAGRDFPYSADCLAWQRPGCQWPHAEPDREWYLPPARLEQWESPRRGRTAGPGGAEVPLAVATDGGGATATESRAARAAQRGFQPGQAGGPSVCVALLSYLEDRTGWDRFVLRASQIEPERGFVSTEANGRAFLACRLPTRLCPLPVWRMHLPVSASCSRCWHVGCCRELGAGELQLRLRVRSCCLDLVRLHLHGGACIVRLPVSSCFTTCNKPASHRLNEPYIAVFAHGLSRIQHPVTIFAHRYGTLGGSAQF